MQKKQLLNAHTPFWLIAISVLIILTVPTLIKDGMFMDGMLYTSVAHNLGNGIGTFWFPQFSLHNLAGLNAFHEQPPLVFGIQAIFFKLFGDSMYIERSYTFIAMCITAFLINLLWKEIYRNNESYKKMGWLPIILWITIPVCFWSYSNNMHENTMTIFTLTASLLIYKSFRVTSSPIKLWILAGIFIFMATLSKGLPGFFPITIPFLYWLTTKRISFSKIILPSLIIVGVPLIIYTILFLIPESKESLSTYLFKRVLHRINEVPTVSNRFYILVRLFMELLPQIALVIIFLLIAKAKKIQANLSQQWQKAILFTTIGIASSLPLMLTLVQKGFYFVPSLPFFAIGLSILITRIIFKLIARIETQSKNYKIFLILSAFLFLSTSTFALLQKGKVSRNKELLSDVYKIGSIVPKFATVSIPPEIWAQWDLQCYLIRYYTISLDVNYKNTYCIVYKNSNTDSLVNYKKINIQTLEYDLYKKK